MALESAARVEFGAPSTVSASFVAGKYRVFATLGRGGMADVFLAAAQGPAGFNKLVVVKKLREARVADASYVTMFLDEARLAARLNHPNVVHTYEVGEQGDGYFIAMEYLEGQPLSRIAHAMRTRNEPLDTVLVAHMLAEALLGLHYAHEMKNYDGTPLGIVHRDVSPQNLHVTYDGQVKVLDFGIAKAVLNTAQTEAGVLKGKFSYMSPEQAAGDDVDRRADVFAAGIVLWEFLAGERLFKGDNAVVLNKLMNLQLPKPSEKNPGVSPELDAIVMRALDRRPDHRFQTAADMSNALQDFVGASGRRVRSEDVARRLEELFGDIRVQLQRQILLHMSMLPPPSTDLASLGSSGATPAYVPSSGVMERVTTDASAAKPTVDPTLASPSPRRVALLAGVGAVGIAVLGLTAGLMLKPTMQGASARAAPESPTVANAAARPAAAAPAMGGEAEAFHLTLSSDPLEAQVEWVGKPVGQTPMLIDLLPGPQIFVLSREGYFNATVVVNVTEAMNGQTQSRTVVMVPRKGAAPSSAQVAQAGRPSGAPAEAHVVTGALGAKSAPARAGEPERLAAGQPQTGAARQAPEPASARPPEVALPVAATAPAAAAPAPIAMAVPAEAPRTSPAALAAPAAPTAASPVAPTVLPFGPDMSRPVLLSGTDPVYTREAIVAGVEGVIIAKCTITAAGTLQNCRIVKGLPHMDKAMLDSLATRKYSPVLYQGKPVAVEYVFNVRLAKPR